MSKRNQSSQQRYSTLPRSRPSIHGSRDALDKSDTQERLTMSRDDSTILTTPKFSKIANEEMNDLELSKTSNESEDDEKNSEISHHTDSEDSSDDLVDDSECKTAYENESLSPQSIRNRFQCRNYKIPEYIIHESSISIKDIYDKEKSDTTDIRPISNVHPSKRSFLFICLLILGVGILCLIYVAASDYLAPSQETFDIKLIKKKFITQDKYLWLAFESGVKDVVKLSRPSTFILLYEKEAEGTLSDLLYDLSKYAVCNITDCSKEPIEISDAELSSSEVLTDYGILIENYRDILRDKGVMIIKNLENVPGISAQAFHSICDEFTPLVDKSLIIFTMKVDKLPTSKDRMKFVEGYFRNKWTDIKVDTFNALITRITSMVIEIRA